jgi:hypothetical protein
MDTLRQRITKIGCKFALILIAFNIIQFTFLSRAQANEPEKSLPAIERNDLRTQSSKTYQIGKQSFRTESYADKVHYKSGSEFRDVNINIVAANDGKFGFRNGANDFTFKAGRDVASGVYYSGPQGVCEFKLLNIADAALNNSTASISGNKVTYKNIYPDADLEFTSLSNGIRTEVVIKNPKAFKPQIEFELINCNPGIFNAPTMQDDGTIAGVNQKVVDEIVTDTPKNESEKNGTKALPTRKIKKLVLTPDYTKLGKIEGEVRVDPEILPLAPVQDIFVTSTYVSTGDRWAMFVGNYTDYTVAGDPLFANSRALMKFNMGSIPAGAILRGANLQVKHYGSNAALTAKVSRVTENWNNDTLQTVNYINDDNGNYGSEYFPVYNTNAEGGGATRTIDLDLNLIEQLKANNQGIAVKPNGASNSLGFVFCASDNSKAGHPCNSYLQGPRLVITYDINQAPDAPNLVSPENNKVFMNDCDESQVPPQGRCRTTYPVQNVVNNVKDGDSAPGDISHAVIYFNGGNNFTSPNLPEDNGDQTVVYNGNFNDGVTTWKARSFDKLGTASNFSGEFRFTTDTTPPVVPTITPLPEYTKGVGIESQVQVEVLGNKTTDNVAAQADIKYYLQYSKTNDFSSDVFVKEWQVDTARFEIGPKGSDQIAGTADDITNEGRYFFRIKARDTLNNTSNWSNVVATTIDGIAPVINEYKISEDRISPNNSTSTGFKDSTEFTVNLTEKYPQTAEINIYNNRGKEVLVKKLTKDISSIPNRDFTSVVTFDWNGTDTAENFIKDGAYTAYAKIIDKAGNEVESEALFITVDNSGANIQISDPIEQLWTKKDAYTIKGQLFVPNEPDKEDTDILSLKCVILMNLPGKMYRITNFNFSKKS